MLTQGVRVPSETYLTLIPYDVPESLQCTVGTRHSGICISESVNVDGSLSESITLPICTILLTQTGYLGNPVLEGCLSHPVSIGIYCSPYGIMNFGLFLDIFIVFVLLMDFLLFHFIKILVVAVIVSCKPDGSGNTESGKCRMRTKCIWLLQIEL